MGWVWRPAGDLGDPGIWDLMRGRGRAERAPRREAPASTFSSLPLSASVLQALWEWLSPRTALPSSVFSPNLTCASSRERGACELGAALPSPGFWAARLPLPAATHAQGPKSLSGWTCQSTRVGGVAPVLSRPSTRMGDDRRPVHGSPRLPGVSSPTWVPGGGLLTLCPRSTAPLGRVSWSPAPCHSIHCASSKLSVHRDGTVRHLKELQKYTRDFRTES